MNETYLINFLIFSVLAALLILEMGIALISLTLYRYYRDSIRKYLLPIWEVGGTFGGFYLVNFEVTYPTLLGLVGQLYIAPLLIAGIFFIIRSVFLAYSEYINDLSKENIFIKIYAISTLAMGFMFFSVLSSGVSGIGINLTAQSINLTSLLFNPFNLMMFLSILLISVFMACNYFKVVGLERFGALYLAIAYLLVILGLYQYVPVLFSSLTSNYYLLALSIFFALLSVIFYFIKNRFANYISVIWLVGSINLFGIVKYPYIFGASDITNYMASQVVAGPLIDISLVGGTIVALSLLYLIYMSYLKKEEQSY